MPKIFESVQLRKPRMSAFDLSHERKLSCRMGELVPVFIQDVLPGDQFMVSTETLMRLAPMLAPVMHRVNVYMHYFFVPNRIIWNQWEAFITGGQDGNSAPVSPTSTIHGANYFPGCLADHLGLPPVDIESVYSVSELPFRAYYQIWNDYYRDPNLENPVDVEDLESVEGYQYFLKQRGWEKDYFTSALPWPQRGPEVALPVEVNYKAYTEMKEYDGDDPANGAPTINTVTPGYKGILSSSGQPMNVRNIEDDAISVSINELRTSSAIQRWLEKQARGGARYIETILSHFGVRSSDARLQRAEYLGGGKSPIVISEVLNTTGTEEAPQGNMAGHGYAVGNTNRFKRSFEEHGFVIGIMSVLPRTAYQQGTHRMWLRSDKFDYAWPEFANLGEQPIYGREIYQTSQADPENTATFGYQQRYAEYKYGCSSVHGAFRDTLDFWHLGRIFDGRPELSAQFTTMSPEEAERIFAVQDDEYQNLWVQLYHNVRARRPLPYFSDPRLM